MRPEDRERIQIEVTHRVVERYVQLAATKPEGYLQQQVNDALYHERLRLERSNPKSKSYKRDQALYGDIRRKLSGASEKTQREMLERVAQRFAGEVVGNFNEKVYRLTTNMIPTGLSFLLNAMSPGRLLKFESMGKNLSDHLVVQGEAEHVRKLLDKGTLLVVPTHSSNLDSIVLGYAVYLMGLPPLVYGAGINLFTNPLISYFMHNLGAYKVDRRKTSKLYKDVLKEYATVAFEFGYHQLFFPGGTRSRGGAVEQKLKKGLLGTAIRAYVNNLINNKDKPNIYVVPCTLSYTLVLEAESLIDDFLRAEGKSRYVEDEPDEFTRPQRIANFFSNIINLDDEIVLTFSKPLDVFGNPVNEHGESLDPQGRIVAPESYVSRDGKPYIDDQRDMQYTNECSQAIAKAYLQDNVLMSTNIVAKALFRLIERANPGCDFYRLLSTGGTTPSFSMSELHDETGAILAALEKDPNKPRLSPNLAVGDLQAIVADGLRHFKIYHTRTAAERRGDRVFHQDRNLLHFYANRLNGYNLDPDQATSAS